MKKLRIAILGPLTRPANFDSRGSRPRIIFDLARGYTERGHEVTSFIPGNSEVSGRVVPVSPKSIYEMSEAENPFYQHVIYLTQMMKKIIEMQSEFDIIHSNLYPEVLPMLISDQVKIPIITTPHLYMWKELVETFKMFPKLPLISVSKFQKEQYTDVNFIDVVYNGIDVNEFEYCDKPEDYFLFFGRMKNGDPKGVTSAIKVAQKTGVKLKIAGNVENPEFYENEIKPHLNDKIKFIGPIDSFGPISFSEKVKLYKNAKGFFFSIHHVEAFGMTMLESMACGTPVLAFNLAAVKEAIIDGENGFICPANDIDTMCEAVSKIDSINRLFCRKYVESKFSIDNMIDGYLKNFDKLLNKRD